MREIFDEKSQILFLACILDKTELRKVANKFRTSRFSDNFALLEAWFVPSKFFLGGVKHVEI